MGVIILFLVAVLVGGLFGREAAGLLLGLFLVGFYLYFEKREAVVRWLRRDDSR